MVIFDPEDLDFAEAMATKVNGNSHLLLQPGWDSESGQHLAVDHVRQHQRWRLSLQTHKWLGVR